jgi:hypothetical protein
LAAQASQALADTTARVLIPAGALRCAAGGAGCRLDGGSGYWEITLQTTGVPGT